MTRGLSNNNPGNIRLQWDASGHMTSGWEGMTPVQSDPDFVQFKGMSWGVRALAKTLLTYQRKHGLHTIEDIIHRWAPPADNNDTDAYIADVSKRLGVGPLDRLDLGNPETLSALCSAICRHENGVSVDVADIDGGVGMAMA